MGSGTDIYLVRHAAAVDGEAGLSDDCRYLTAKGRKVFSKVASELKGLGISFDLIVTSPLVRAVQTAEILAGETKYRGEVVAATALGPGGRALDHLLRTAGEMPGSSVAFVGHEPRMGQLAGELLGRGAMPFRKGQVMRIVFSGGVAPGVTGRFKWALMPSGERVDSLKDLEAA